MKLKYIQMYLNITNQQTSNIPKWPKEIKKYSTKYCRIVYQWMREKENELSFTAVHNITNLILIWSFYMEPIADALSSLDVTLYEVNGDIRKNGILIEDQNMELISNCYQLAHKLNHWSKSFINAMTNHTLTIKFISILLNSTKFVTIINILCIWIRTEWENASLNLSKCSKSCILITQRPHHVVFKLIHYWPIRSSCVKVHQHVFILLDIMTQYLNDNNTKNILINDGIYNVIRYEVDLLDDMIDVLDYDRQHLQIIICILHLMRNLIKNRVPQEQEEKDMIVSILRMIWTKNQEISEFIPLDDIEQELINIVFISFAKYVFIVIKKNPFLWSEIKDIITLNEDFIATLLGLLYNEYYTRLILYITADDDDNEAIIAKFLEFNIIQSIMQRYPDAKIAQKKHFLLIISNIMCCQDPEIINSLFLNQENKSLFTFLFDQLNDNNNKINNLTILIFNNALLHSDKIKIHSKVFKYKKGIFIKKICKILREFDLKQGNYKTIDRAMDSLYAIIEFMQINTDDGMIQFLLNEFEQEDIGNILQNKLRFIKSDGCVDIENMNKAGMKDFIIESIHYLINLFSFKCNLF